MTSTLLLALSVLTAGCQDAGSGPAPEKAKESFNVFIPEGTVKSVEPTPVKGVYEVVVEDSGRLGVVYMSADGRYILTGSLLDSDRNENVTDEKLYEITKVDFSTIPLSNSITLGAPDGKRKLVVFSDPSCMPCALYHEELKKAVKEDSDLTVYLKVFALPGVYPKSYEKARAIACSKDNDEALKRLEASYLGGETPLPDCKTDVADENMALASSLKVLRSPTTIFPNGVKIAVAMRAEDLLKELGKRGARQ